MEKVLVSSITAIAGVTAVVTFYFLRSKWKRKQNHSRRVEIKIHNAEVGHLIGRCGERIKDILQKSGAKIKFFLEEGTFDYCVCIIEGDESKVQKARSLMYQILKQCAEMDMSSCFVIKGTAGKFDDSSYFEEGDSQADDNLSQQSLMTSFVAGHTQKLETTNNDGFIPVYVSAVATPEDFWVQPIKTKEHIELDRMTEELQDYYETNPIFNIRPSYNEVKQGFICATKSIEDGRWYRTEVNEIFTLNEMDAGETNVDLYFLDYGVTCYQKLKNIRKIPKKFLELKFQAIESQLSNLQPNGESWSEESISFFEDITRAGHWYTLMARLDQVDENGHPQITLFDSNSGVDINLADEMVKRGFAKYSFN